MSYRSERLGIFPIYCIAMLGIGLMNHVMVLPMLLQVAKRSAWISVLLSVVPYLIWIAAMHFIMKRLKQQALMPWLRNRFGPLSSRLMRIAFLIYLFFISGMTLKDTVTWTHGTYLPRTPEFVLSLTLMLLCFSASRLGIRAIAYVAGILLPFVVLFGDFVMSANLPRKNYKLLTPMLEDGLMPVLGGALYVGGGLAELVILLLIQHQLKKEVRYWSLAALGIFLIVLILGPVTGAIGEFGPVIAASLRYPAFEEWRLVKLGRYIQHIDFLSIYQWLSGAFVRISVAVFLMTEMITDGKRSNDKRSVIALICICVILVALMSLPFSDMEYLSLLKMYLPLSLCFAIGVIVILMLLVFIPERSKVKPND
ncbi:GerAB/ArcD/ProY family transporter [Cohnella panacarvi]|uniref:GerAB/ArcD/ProY family transporter n=1 Tax=Cohnella panacarvi TaxID=400776 RepID=UPI00047EA8B8|nr:endospore germination permease [Cohnella panacarvi]